jgi:hypothetical protein
VVDIGVLATAVTAAHWRSGGIGDRFDFDPTARSLAGLFLGQIAIGVLGVLVMSAEYSTGTLRVTLGWASGSCARLYGGAARDRRRPLDAPRCLMSKPNQSRTGIRLHSRHKEVTTTAAISTR